MAIGHIKDDELGDLWGVVADNLVGKSIAGENFYIHSTKPDGTNMSFVVDGTGVTTYNSHQKWIKGGWGIAIDPDYGFFINDGTHPLYKTVGSGASAKQVPYCCNNDGTLRLTDDKYPDGANVWIGLDGNLHVVANIYATGGVFNGIVKATDFQLPSGDSMVSILNNDKKISSDWLDLMGINVKDTNGNTVMTIDGQNGITIQKGSIQWGSILGKPSIPNVPSYIKSTKITKTTIESPNIVGGKVTGTEIFGGIFGDYDGTTPIADWNPNVWIEMGDGDFGSKGFHVWSKGGGSRPFFSAVTDEYSQTSLFVKGVEILKASATNTHKPQGTWDFSDADTTGIHLTLA